MWNGQQFSERHNHSLHGAAATHAAHIANAILRRSGDEGMAIATANKLAGHGIMHREEGGSVDPSQSLGGIAPTPQTMNPMVQGMVQRYSAMPTEKLAELGAMMGGSPQGQIIQRLLSQRHTMPQQTAPATTQQARGGATPRRASGGDMGISASQGSPWWTRREATTDSSGFLHGSTPGRADQIKTTAPAGAYVVPADVISGLGEGNSLAGAKIMDSIVRSGPHGIAPQPSARGAGAPRAPAPFREAKGGGVQGGPEQGATPVALSHGEYVVIPEHVIRWGRGDHKKGIRIFDRFVVETRKRIIKDMQKLPGPVGAKAA